MDEVNLVCYNSDFWNSEVSCKVSDEVRPSRVCTDDSTNVYKTIQWIVWEFTLIAGNNIEKILVTTLKPL